MNVDISNAINPAQLEQICVKYVAENLLLTICKGSPDEHNLRLSANVSLPHAVTDLIVQSILDSLQLDPLQKEEKSEKLVTFLKVFTDPDRCKLRHITIKRAPISDDIVQVLCDMCSRHPLIDIDLSNSNDMNGDDKDHTPPYNHAILLPGFIMKLCGKTLQRLVLHNTLLAHSINQITTCTGWRAKNRPRYIQSEVRIGNIPVSLSKNLCPQLTTLDVSNAFNAWFLTIDPKNPPPLKVLNVDGYRDIYLNSTAKKLLKQFVEGEEEEPPRTGKPRETMAHSTSERKLYHYPFFKLIEPADNTLNEFLEASSLAAGLRALDSDSQAETSNNFVFRQLNVLSMKQTLQRLSLYNTWLSKGDLEDVVFQLKGLENLDVGWPSKSRLLSQFRPEGITVWRILKELPLLKSLDVSGTTYGENLLECVDVDAEMRGRQPLQFLGLWGTKTCKSTGLEKIALNVSGDKDESQLLTCLEIYIDRPEMVHAALSKFSNIQQDSSCRMPNRALKLFIKIAQRYSTSGNLLFMCAANIYYLAQFQMEFFTVYQKRDIISTIIHLLEKNPSNQMLVRNCLVMLFLFDLPGDLIFDFDHIAKCILDIFDKQRDVNEVNSIAGNLCNALVCSMEVDLKTQIRKLPYVQTMINIIKGRLRTNNADDVLDTAWSALWNVSDETPSNSKDFIDQGGLNLFHQCHEKFPGRSDLIRNMMGLLGNISEVKELRHYLAEKDMLNLIIKLVRSSDAGIEVAYNACGILAHLLVDSSDILKGVDVEHIRNEMREAILSWDVDVARNINYRTFHPLFEILRSPGEPVAHLWVVWAIHNLCQRDDNYVTLVIKDGGVGLLKELRENAKFSNTKEYVQAIIEKCDRKEGSPV